MPFERLTQSPSVRDASATRWVEKYRAQRVVWRQELEVKRAAAAEKAAARDRKLHAAAVDHRARLMDLAVELPPLTDRDARPWERWEGAAWGRNDVCEVSGLPASPGQRRECAFCPVVVRTDRLARMHRQCGTDEADCVVSRIDGLPHAARGPEEAAALAAAAELHAAEREDPWQRALGTDGPCKSEGDWVCAQCVLDARANRRLQAERRRRQAREWGAQRSAITLQAFMRMATARKQYNRALFGATMMAARMRAKQTLRFVDKRQRVIRRPFFITVHKCTGLAEPKGTTSASAKTARAMELRRASTMSKTGGGGDASGGDAAQDITPYVIVTVLNGASFKQLFRFDTAVGGHGDTAPEWEETFTVHGMDGNVIVLFTVVSHDAQRGSLLGQAAVRLRGTDAWKKGLLLRDDAAVPLGPYVQPPLLTNRQPLRLHNQDAPSYHGCIAVSVRPCPNAHSVSSQLDEKGSVLSQGTNRQWWGSLMDGFLRLFGSYGEPRPKHSLNLRKVDFVKEPPGAASVQLRMPDKTWTFGLASQELAHEWAIKVRSWAPKCGGQARRQVSHQSSKHPPEPVQLRPPPPVEGAGAGAGAAADGGGGSPGAGDGGDDA